MRRNTAVTITVGMVALCAMLLPAAAGAVITTGISGKVTEAEAPHAGVTGANVCVYTEFGALIECKTGVTNASGEYTIEESPGKYKVGFNASGFTTQYYNGVSSLEEAQTVTVTSGKIAEHVDAELESTTPGTITGRVTDASNGQGAGGVEACVYGPSGNHCAETNGNGEYTISGLSAGSYTINFFSAVTCEEEQGEKVRCQPKSNYIRQSTLVKVKANKTETVNVALQPGGQIGGTVTNASITHPGLAKVSVCATKFLGKKAHEWEEYGPGGCSWTNSSGQYTISGLESGSYKVTFSGYICSILKKGEEEECPEMYVTQFYHGKQTLKQAETVSVSAGSNTGGVNETLREAFPTTPASTAAPALTGTPVVGQTLSCSQGSWSHEPTYLVYQWLRNGTVIAGQAGPTYTVQAADSGHSMTCSITAGNGAGAATATSNALAIPVPLAVVKSVKVKGSNVSVKLSCPGVAPCSGVMKIVAKHGKRNVTIGAASFSIKAGKSVTLRVHLTGTGRSLLAHAGRRGLKVKIGGTGVKPHSATLKRHR